MILSGTRGLARLAANPGCGLLAMLVRARADDLEVARLLGAGAGPDPGPGRRERRRGVLFERRLLADGARELRVLLEPVAGSCAGTPEALDLSRGSTEFRLAETRTALQNPGPRVLLHPLLELRAGPAQVLVEPDALLTGAPGPVPVEIKSFIVAGGHAPEGQLAAARLQAAAAIVALQDLGLLDEESCGAILVPGTPWGMEPHGAVREDLDPEVAAVRAALDALSEAPDLAGATAVAAAAPSLGIHLQDSCVGGCPLLAACRMRDPGHPSILGDAVAGLLPSGIPIARLVALATGARAGDAREREAAPLLRAAARQSGLRR